MIIAIVGPTGIGKTALSISLAKHYNAEIINFDAMQVYEKMDIGTAKVTTEEFITYYPMSMLILIIVFMIIKKMLGV